MHPVDVLLLLTDGHRVLLARRSGTGYADGQWNLPSGKLEHGEDALSAMIREASEEIDIRLQPQDLRLATVVHHHAAEQMPRVGIAFTAAFDPARHGEPVNAEPHKCSEIAWFAGAELPADTYPYTSDCVRAFLLGQPFVLSGWH